MRNLKRALSLAVASVMLVGMMVVGTGASYADVTSDNNQEAIEVLQAVGAMVGDTDGNFNPDQNVTRNEMAVIMSNLLDYKVANYAGTAPFVDVPDWAEPYVAACYTHGITGGTSATTYSGDDNVTATQAALMMLKALGYFQYSSDFGENWELATIRQANKIDLYDNVDVAATAPMTRNDVAQLALNTLEATMVDVSGEPAKVITPDGTTVTLGAAEYYDLTKTGTKYTAISNQKDSDDSTKYYVQLGEDLYDGDLVKKSTSADDMGRPSIRWEYKGDKIGEYAEDVDDVLVINVDDTTTVQDVLKDKKYFNLSNSDIDAAVTYYLNGDEVTSGELKAGDKVEIFENDDNEVYVVAISRYEVVRIDDVDDDVTSTDSKNGTSYYVSIEDLDDKAVGDGTYNDDDFKGFNDKTYVEDAYVAIALNDNDEIVDSYVVEAVDGTVSAYKANKNITIGGTKYNLAGGYQNTVGSDNFSFDEGSYVVYLTAEDYVLGIDGESEVNLEDVFYVYGVYFTKAANGSTTYYAQVVGLDGVIDEIQIEETTYKDTFKQSGSDNTFYGIRGLYTFTDKDAVDAGDKNENGDTATVDAKSNNGKFSAEQFDHSRDSSLYVFAGKGIDDDLKRDSGSVTLTGSVSGYDRQSNKAYLRDTTKYVAIEGKDAEDLDVTTAVGGIKVKDTDVSRNSFIIATKSGSSYVAEYVILAGADMSSTVEDASTIVYLKSNADTKVKDGYLATLYLMDGTVLEDVTVDNNYSKGQFYTFDVDEDGIYELDPYTSSVYGTLSGNFKYDDEDGALRGVTLDSIFESSSLSIDALTVGSYTVTVTDADLSADLQVVDTRGSAERDASAYKTEVTSLSKLEAAMDKGVVVADIYLENGEVTFIAVKSAESQASTLESAISEAILGNGDDVTDINDEIVPDKGLVSVELEDNTLTLNANGKINDSGIVDELTTRLASVLSNIESVRFDGKTYESSEIDDLAAAIKKAVNDAVPEAGETATEEWTIRLNMKDETVVSYDLVVNYDIPEAAE